MSRLVTVLILSAICLSALASEDTSTSLRLLARKVSNKDPLYLGIFARENPKEMIKGYVIKFLEETILRFPNNAQLKANLLELKSGQSKKLKYVNDYHITTLYLGGDPQKKLTPYYTKFKEGIEIDIEAYGVAFVPNKIYAGFCILDQSIVPVENNFPHVTLLTGEWSAVKSNNLLESLFGEGAPFETEFKNGLFTKAGSTFFREAAIKVDGETVTAYFLKMPKNLVIPAATKAAYSA